jgi:hypothetical protein
MFWPVVKAHPGEPVLAAAAVDAIELKEIQMTNADVICGPALGSADRAGFCSSTQIGLSLLAAAMALPMSQAFAEAQPDHGLISLKLLNYQDSQPGQDRIKVTAPGLSVMTPVGSNWSITANAVVDSISGASPAYHTEALTNMHDERRAIDVAATRYFPEGTITVGGNYSTESDYISRGISLGATRSSEDKNTTWNFGLNLAHDTINPSNGIVVDESKDIQELSVGLTQVLTQNDIAQAIVGYSHGTGYFSDPYKVFDNRPRERNNSTFLLRWNHFVAGTGGTARLSYRYYDDSYNIQAHTLAAEYVQPLPNGWTLTPQIRLYSQSAASFYVDLDPASAPFPTNPPATATFFTEDQRLAAYGAHSFSLKLGKQLDDKWQVDFKVDRYDQNSSYRLAGSGSPYLEPFTAITYQLGISRRF